MVPDSFKGIIIVILLVVSFVILPAQRNADLTEKKSNDFAKNAVVDFVDTVRSKGYIDVRDYNVMIKSLEASNQVFDVQLEYYKKVIQPNYLNPNDISTFENTFNVRYDGYFTSDILNRLYPSTTVADDDPSRRFNMHVGDLFNVRIVSKERTLSSKIKSFLFHSPNVANADQYGGMIRSEAP